MCALTTIHVTEFPDCDLCGKPAPYDVKTTMGPWGNLCENCFVRKGTKTGSKREIIKKAKAIKTRADFDTFPPIAVVPMKADKGVPDEILAIMGVDSMPDTIQTVKCPWCKQSKRVELDANYLVTCESCGNPYRCRSQI